MYICYTKLPTLYVMLHLHYTTVMPMSHNFRDNLNIVILLLYKRYTNGMTSPPELYVALYFRYTFQTAASQYFPDKSSIVTPLLHLRHACVTQLTQSSRRPLPRT